MRKISLYYDKAKEIIKEKYPKYKELKMPDERKYTINVIEIKDPVTNKALKTYNMTDAELYSLDFAKRKEIKKYIKETYIDPKFKKYKKEYDEKCKEFIEKVEEEYRKILEEEGVTEDFVALYDEVYNFIYYDVDDDIEFDEEHDKLFINRFKKFEVKVR